MSTHTGGERPKRRVAQGASSPPAHSLNSSTHTHTHTCAMPLPICPAPMTPMTWGTWPYSMLAMMGARGVPLRGGWAWAAVLRARVWCVLCGDGCVLCDDGGGGGSVTHRGQCTGGKASRRASVCVC
jgi:hypothetical protein